MGKINRIQKNLFLKNIWYICLKIKINLRTR